MKTVFYSWQSDLPNNQNRGFIEACIMQAIKGLNISEQYSIEFAIDRDTREEMGTPHIATSIFKKIERATFFIADISIINSNFAGRKMPNPNVLVELGYAAKVLGWENIICIYNLDYGTYEDLPFDLKFRRPLCYSFINSDKSLVKRKLTKIIKDNLESLTVNNIMVTSGIGKYLILEAGSYYFDLENTIINIFQSVGFQKRFQLDISKISVDIWNDLEYRIDNQEPCGDTDIEHHINIYFSDDTHSHVGFEDSPSSVFFSIKESFKQINFVDKKVYVAFEIITKGYSKSKMGRNYEAISDYLVKMI